MRRASLALLTLLALAMVQSCSRVPGVRLLNNFGSVVELLRVEPAAPSGYASREGSWLFGLVWINDGEGRDILYRAAGTATCVELKLGGRAQWYFIPHTRTSYNGTDVIQLQPDRLLYLVEENAGMGVALQEQPVSELPEQPEWFPATPEISCPSAG